ncbi:MAG: YicC family protein [Lachnospiraceae bacterium]|nr:YicC family protein [Lachnospiraceae bacterium]
MAYSMTGFGRCTKEATCGRLTIEIKSVNHRFLDVSVRMPRELSFLEMRLRDTVRRRIVRGKVDVSVSFEGNTDENISLKFNLNIAKSYLEGASEMESTFGIKNDMTTVTLSSLPYVFEKVTNQTDEDEMTRLLDDSLEEALDNFENARKSEGDRLVKDILQKTDELLSYVSDIEERSPQIVAAYKEKINEKLSEFSDITEGIDSSRLALEVTMYADKICVDEEIVRLKSHVKETVNVLKKDGEVGRRLDFLSQEMNREANTILSKSVDVKTDNTGVSMKTVIEKIREQIQNLE